MVIFCHGCEFLYGLVLLLFLSNFRPVKMHWHISTIAVVVSVCVCVCSFFGWFIWHLFYSVSLCLCLCLSSALAVQKYKYRILCVLYGILMSLLHGLCATLACTEYKTQTNILYIWRMIMLKCLSDLYGFYMCMCSIRRFSSCVSSVLFSLHFSVGFFFRFIMCVFWKRNIVERRGKMHNIQVHAVGAFIY